MADITQPGPPRWLFSYVQDSKPSNPDEAESWYDTGSNEVKVYNGSAWKKTGVVSHDALTNISSADHHQYPIPTTGLAADAVTQAKIAADAVTKAQVAVDAIDTPQLVDDAVDAARIAADAVQAAQIAADAVGPTQAALGNALGGDGAGNIAVQSGSIGGPELSFDPATQAELNNHANDANAHHNPPKVYTVQKTVPAGGSTKLGWPIAQSSIDSWSIFVGPYGQLMIHDSSPGNLFFDSITETGVIIRSEASGGKDVTLKVVSI